MAKTTDFDPYAGNLLTEGLGPLRSRPEVMATLTKRPKVPQSMDGIPRHIALHMLMAVRDFHIPSLEECRLHETMELMVRQNYRYLDPTAAQTWATVGGDKQALRPVRTPAYGAAVVGHSGTGKTAAISRCLESYPSQIVEHRSFPKLIGGHRQVVWLSIDVPASGRAADLAMELMRAWDRATGGDRFELDLATERRNGMKMLDSWRQVASAHFLGILHLDEIQNLFKLPTLKQRNGKSRTTSRSELTIVEDQSLKWILTLMNTWQVPLLTSGTPDGMRALTRRLSTTERIVTSGYHKFDPFENARDNGFRKNFLDQLGRYQFVQKKILVDDELAHLIIELTAGIHRLIIALWIAAQRIALERSTCELRLDDFKKAASTYLAPVAPAVAALRSGDPHRMTAYEDLLPSDGEFWSQFWVSVGRM